MAAERKYKVATQTEVQDHASEDFRCKVKWRRDGAIGYIGAIHGFEGARPRPQSAGGTPSPSDSIAHSADFQYGGKVTQTALLGDIAIRNKGKLLRFEAKKESFIDHEAATRAFEFCLRPGWELPA